MSNPKFDVVIIGAGLSGLWCAREIATSGKSVMLVDRKKDISKGVHTTGIFVRKTFEDFLLPQGTLGPQINEVSLYSPRLTSIDIKSDAPEFRAGDMPAIYRSLLEQCIEKGVEFASETRFVGCERNADLVTVNLEKDLLPFSIIAKVLIGADGAKSNVAAALCLDRNKETIVGYERVYKRKVKIDKAKLHCFVNVKIAPGYLAWVSDDGHELHVGVGGYPDKFDPKKSLEKFEKEIVVKQGLMPDADLKESRGGIIPVGGVLKNISNEHGLLIGDAAGAVSPLTAGGLDPCLRLSMMAAKTVIDRINADDPKLLLQYSGRLFRSRFISRLWMRRIISLLNFNFLIDSAFLLVKNPFGMKFVRHVFFGRGSFPDIEKAKINSKRALI